MFRKLLIAILRFAGKDIPPVGLKKLPEDDRDLGFSISSIFGGEYTPKYDRKVLSLPFEAKTQLFNTCNWTASAGAKEYDEQVELDQDFLIIKGCQKGMVSGDGFSDLRSAEKVLMDDGVCEKRLLRQHNGDWPSLSAQSRLTNEAVANAAKHKTKSFSSITKVSDVYRAIDDGRPVKIGISWRTAFNMGGGFSSPFILNFLLGYVVGGHAVYICGYDKNYKLKDNKVFVVRNSYGNSYGDNSFFYIKEKDLQVQINYYGAFVNYDMPSETISWLTQHQNSIVKSDKSPNVYQIKGDKKFKFPDMATVYSHKYVDTDIIMVDSTVLDKVVDGGVVNFWEGENVKQMKLFAQKLKDKDTVLIDNLKKYFSELF